MERTPLIDRISSKFRVTPSCWTWTASTKNGYGCISSGGKGSPTLYAHRMAYEQWIGDIPPGKLVRHRCDNPLCINPDHLELGSNADNNADMVGRHRQNNNNPTHVLNYEERMKVKEMLIGKKFTQDQIAREFGISSSVVCRVNTGKAWAK